MLSRPSGSKQQKKTRINPENSFERTKKKSPEAELPPPPDTYTNVPEYLLKRVGFEIKNEAARFASNFWKQILGIESSSSPQNEMVKQAEKQNGQSHTPLDFDKLQQSYDKEDKPQLEALRNKFHQMVNTDTEKAIETRKKEEEKRKKAEAEEEQRKKEEEEQEKQEQMAADEPQGKQKAVLGQPRKKAKVDTNFESGRKKG